MARKILLGDAYYLRRDNLSLEVAGLPDRRILRHRQHPLHTREPLLRIQKLGQLDHVGVSLDHPVVAGDSRIERA